MNPLSRTVEVCRLTDARWVLLATHVGSVQVPAEPFQAVEVDWAPLWGEA